MKPRDFVLLEALGTLTRADTQRAGCFLSHSVDLPTCGDLSHHDITRGRCTSNAMYTPLADGNAVNSCVRGRAEPNGKMTPTTAISLAASALLRCGAQRLVDIDREGAHAINKD